MKPSNSILLAGAVGAGVLSALVLCAWGRRGIPDQEVIQRESDESARDQPEENTQLTPPLSVPVIVEDRSVASPSTLDSAPPVSPSVIEERTSLWSYRGRAVDGDGAPLANVLIGGRAGRLREFMEGTQEEKPHWVPPERIPLTPLAGECFTGAAGRFEFTSTERVETPYAVHANGEVVALPVRAWHRAPVDPERGLDLGDVRIARTQVMEFEFLHPDGARELFPEQDSGSGQVQVTPGAWRYTGARITRVEFFKDEEFLHALSGTASRDGIFRLALGHLDSRELSRVNRLRVLPPSAPVIEEASPEKLHPFQRRTYVLAPTYPLRLRVIVLSDVTIPAKHSPRFELIADIPRVKPDWPVSASGLGARCTIPLRSGVWDIDLPVLEEREFSLAIQDLTGWGVAELFEGQGPFLAGKRRQALTIRVRPPPPRDPSQERWSGCGSISRPMGSLRVLDAGGKVVRSCSVFWENGAWGALESGVTQFLNGTPSGSCMVQGQGLRRQSFRGTQYLVASAQTLSGKPHDDLEVVVRMEPWQEVVIEIAGLSDLERSLVPPPSMRASPKAFDRAVRLPDSRLGEARWRYRINAGTWQLRSSSILFGALQEDLKIGNRTGPQIFRFEVD